MTQTVYTYFGLSTDDKNNLPQFEDHKATGTCFFELDTTDLYMYHAPSETWYKL